MGRMQTISVRLPDEEFQWLLSAHGDSAKTPSERLRELVARTKQQELGLVQEDACAQWMQELSRPLAATIASFERRHAMHSELLRAVTEYVPRIMATLVSSRISDREGEDHGNGGRIPGTDARDIEAELMRQCFHLFSALLRGAITSIPPAYDKSVLEQYLPDIIELAEIIKLRKEREGKNA